MRKYNIYHGLGGGFGGARYDFTASYETKREAEQEAYDFAVEDYMSYAGYNGILSEADIREDYCFENCLDEDHLSESDYEEIEELFLEEIEGWIDYKAIPVDEDDEMPESLSFAANEAAL